MPDINSMASRLASKPRMNREDSSCCSPTGDFPDAKNLVFDKFQRQSTGFVFSSQSPCGPNAPRKTWPDILKVVTGLVRPRQTEPGGQETTAEKPESSPAPPGGTKLPFNQARPCVHWRPEHPLWPVFWRTESFNPRSQKLLHRQRHWQCLLPDAFGRTSCPPPSGCRWAMAPLQKTVCPCRASGPSSDLPPANEWH